MCRLPTSSCQHSLWMPCYLEVLTSLGSWNFWKIICIKKFCILHYCRYLDEVLLLKPLFLLQNSCDSNNTVFQYQPSKAFSPSDWATNGKSYSNILIWCLTVWWPHDISFVSTVDIKDYQPQYSIKITGIWGFEWPHMNSLGELFFIHPITFDSFLRPFTNYVRTLG